MAELRQYLVAQLMWDPRRDPGMVRLEFCNGYYGPAAHDVLDYLALLDRTAQDPHLHAFGAWDPQTTVSPEFVAAGLQHLTRARTRADRPEIAQRVAKLLLPLWYMQLAYPDRYGLAPAQAPSILLEFRSVVQANRITHVREGGENMAGWLAEMEARYGPVPEALVYDLYLHQGQARRQNCLDWRPETIQQEGHTLLSLFHHPPAQGPADATYEVPLPELEEGKKLVLRFATGLTGPTEDGVRFALVVNGREVWYKTQKELPPVDHAVDLSAWAGETISLTLRVEALGNERYDWAHWVRPQVVIEPLTEGPGR